MPVIDLRRYIVASAGTWTDPSQDQNLFGFTIADTMSAERLMLRWAGDFVALTGPLVIRVTVQAENLTLPVALVGNLAPALAGNTVASSTSLAEPALGHFAGTGALSQPQASTIYDYTLNIAAGQAWPFSLSEQVDALRSRSAYASRFEQLGNNLGYRVVIEPAFAVTRRQPVAYGGDLPCDFAVADQPDSASFFPVACEPCQGSVIGLPPAPGSVTLVTPPAEGGCVRTRFFNGMFITREDLETEQRYQRLKSRLHNRAMGAGVVWGLAVGRQGSALCVEPGYAVDCCGNDLALTTLYKVDVAALFADPAAASLRRQKGPQRAHLLLEYVECPSDPRPVHGDPCTPEASRCEMSRIREAVRLRLVPPRDYSAAKESAPITHFLNGVRELQNRYPLAAGPAVVGADRAPYQLTIRSVSGVVATVTVRPSSQFDAAQLQPLIGSAPGSITVDVIPDPMWKFISGTQSGQALLGQRQVGGVVQPADPVNLSPAAGSSSAAIQTTFALSNQTAVPDQLIFKVSNWQAQNLLASQGDAAPSGDLTVTFEFSDRQIKSVQLVETPIANNPLSLAPAPCAGEPCMTPQYQDPASVFEQFCEPLSGTAADPTAVLPWLHADPMRPSSAADPKVLVLAALGGWLTQMMVRERAGTANEILSTRREIAQGIYRLAWTLLFGVSAQADAAALGSTLKQLLEAWCCELLWRGPQCCGEPHGVVIGCAVVEGGAIQSIDPFGGRRYVVHYPLLEHWAGQFGIAPPDITLSRFFSKLCCIAALPGIGGSEANMPPQGMLVQLGDGYLAVGDPAQFAPQIRENRIAIVAKREVGIPEMIASALTLSATMISPKARTGDQQSNYTALVLARFVADQSVMLLTPA